MFCSIKKANSREHVYGAWWGKHLNEAHFPKDFKLRHLTSNFTEDGRYERLEGPFRPAQKSSETTFKVVCSSCNNGWMNQIEQGMQGAFVELYRGNSRRIRSEKRAEVSNWLFLKGLLQDRSIDLFRVTDLSKSSPYASHRVQIQSARGLRYRKFFQSKSVPEGYETYLFRNVEADFTRTNYVLLPALSLNEESEPEFEILSYHLTALGEFCAIQSNFPNALAAVDSLPEQVKASISGSMPSHFMPESEVSAREIDTFIVRQLNEAGITCFGPISGAESPLTHASSTR
jgi:hypothetical protein